MFCIMKKFLLSLVAISLIVIWSLTYANDFIVHDTTGWTITIYTWDFSYGITIQDKNLWAENTGDIWSYFQWWNNNGNPWDSETVDTLLPRDDSYDNKGYDGLETKFIQNSNGDIWSGYQHHDKLWWGENDNDTNQNILKWYDTSGHVATNFTWRQWPCDSGYHVPSAWEWHELMMLRCRANSDICIDEVIKQWNRGNYLKFNTINPAQRFLDDLILPGAGYRRYHNGSIGMNDSAYYWSSSPIDNNAWIFRVYSTTIDFYPQNRGFGQPVRCFKNRYVDPTKYEVTFELNNWEDATTTQVVEWLTATEPSPAPTWNKATFIGWYTDPKLTQSFNFSTPITQDITLYAKWDCNTWYAQIIWDDGERNCFEYQELPALVWQNGKKYILMDRNLWARVAWDFSVNVFDYDNSANYDTENDYYGYYYQWGNNYGFSAKTTWWDVWSVISTDIPSNYASSIWSTTNSWNPENNLWWDDTDSDQARQWPCPSGWHVPSSGEWIDIKSAWCESKWYYSSCDSGQEFAEALKLPSAGYRHNYYLSFEHRGDYGFYWSSSPIDSNRAYNLLILSDFINPQRVGDSRSTGFPVRCLRNSNIVDVTFDSQGWSDVTSQSVAIGETITEPEAPTKEDYSFAGWYASTDSGQTLSDTPFDFTGTAITWDITLYAKWWCPEWKVGVGKLCVNPKDIVIQATSTAADQTLKINRYFTKEYTVDRWDGNPVLLTWDIEHTYTDVWTHTITLSLTWWSDRWKFAQFYQNKPLVPTDGTTMTWVKIVYMPSLEDWFGDSATDPWDYFFYAFNYEWALESLPDWSFRTENITTVGKYFFAFFNYEWALESLPENSFQFPALTTIGDCFFFSFNKNWALESLPVNSFQFPELTSVEDDFLYSFNYEWALESLPENSFQFPKLTTVWDYFFADFNSYWALENLPENLFQFPKLTSVWDYFFKWFNQHWALTRLPKNSFQFPELTSVGDDSFEEFNSYWALESLPENSFQFPKLTTVWNYFFYCFNESWALKSLPENSFQFPELMSVGIDSFSYFNYKWALESLPENSFQFPKLATVGLGFFDYFNRNWKIQYLPNSFTFISALSENWWYLWAFDSPDYPLLNRKVSDVVAWVTVPSSDMDTFSDNQPWRCGVHANRLDTTADACSITYNDGVWGTWEFKYAADATWVVVWSGMSVPSRTGFVFLWWANASWNIVEEVTFPEMDGTTLTAQWKDNTPSWWGSSGGWGGRSNKTSDTQDSSATPQNDNKSLSWTEVKDPRWDTQDSSDNASEWQTYTQEFQNAYEFAKQHWITTMPTIEEANMEGPLTRIAMAKMLSYYAINVLWQKPDETRINKFNDIPEELDKEYDNGVTLAYQLWIMWINMPDNNFRPDDEVTRAEFTTALSRMLYGLADGNPFYSTHLAKLKSEWIISNDDPDLKEVRGYVMIMLMRSAK